MVLTTEGFLEVAIASWLKWDLNPRPYSGVMKTVQCTHPPHNRNGFVATCRLG